MIEIQENEVVTFLLGTGVLIFILASRSQLRRLPASRLHIAAFLTLLAGWGLTIVEGFFWRDFFNVVEHLCYAISSVLLAAWCWKVTRNRETEIS